MTRFERLIVYTHDDWPFVRAEGMTMENACEPGWLCHQRDFVLGFRTNAGDAIGMTPWMMYKAIDRRARTAFRRGEKPNWEVIV